MMATPPVESPRDLPYKKNATALLFVDMQEVWIRPGLAPQSEEGESSYYFNRLRNTVIPNQQALLSAFRGAQQNVLHTIIESLTEDGRDRSLDHKLSNIHLPKGHSHAQVISELAPVANEIVLPKTSSGVFNSTAIDYVLRNLGVEQLVICGVVTDQCVDMAVRDAADRGYLVTMVEDACATQSEARHRSCLNAIKGYCFISDTQTVLEKVARMQG
ncbi:hypothetical protein GCM10007160_18580 [Litchfieldella qijiaojingensis]|uniref:Isochorismatase-like domain-containing protein n=2 Tax=Litchfieldella qijiaojingensis TaxID=980347 RepID=A0ABQ2YSV7_9GAMM|nr:hypothetical protein GCM10007160_18580 [Halomonas qijiaojingensis]